MVKLRGGRYADGADPALVSFIRYKLPFLPFAKAQEFYAEFVPQMTDREVALLGCNDRFFLLTVLCNRPDAISEWCYDRCREVEASPDGHIDLWSRYHYKSTIITFAGVISEILNDPEITIGIFSAKNEVAKPFLRQIKEELERNEDLKRYYPDVLYLEPSKESPLWSAEKGIIVKRLGNPKEATVEAWGVIDGMPTGKHYMLRVYDDLVTEKSVTQTDTDQIGRTTFQFELSLNLGTHISNRMWIAGTRYHFADTYGVIIDRGTAKLRKYAATVDGTLNGKPRFLTPEKWAEVKRDQRKTIAAQMLLNPLAGEEATFLLEWLRPYEVRPAILNVYILGDPSMGRNSKSDRTALIVVGIDPTMNFYLLDGYCHRMRLSQRRDKLFELQDKWSKMPGVYSVDVGYERYGVQADIEAFEMEMQRNPSKSFAIREVNWVNEGPQAKSARIGRIEPDFRNSKFWMPPYVWIPKVGKCTWRIVQQMEAVTDASGNAIKDRVTGKQLMQAIEGSAEIKYTPYRGPSSAERECVRHSEPYRVMEPIRRRDEDGNIYDLFRSFAEEFKLHPFGAHDDILDATSRVWDMEPVAPVKFESIDESPESGYPD